MANDLQELKVLLQVRDREFARALTKNTQRVDRFSRQSNRSLSKTTKGFNNLALAMRGLLPALGAAMLISKVRRVAAEMDEIGKTADNLGLTTDALQELRVVAESSGMSFDGFTKAFQKFTVGIGEATEGTGTARDALEKLGVTIYDASGQVKSSERIFNEVSDALNGFTNESVSAGIAADLFGQRVGVQMLNLLRNGSDGMAEMREEARKLGVVIDEDLIRKAEASQTQLDLLSRVLNAQVSTALINVIPLIVSAGNMLVWLSDKAGKAAEGMAFAFRGFQFEEGSVERAAQDMIQASAQQRDMTDELTAARERLAASPSSGLEAEIAEQSAALLTQIQLVESLTTAHDELSNAGAAPSLITPETGDGLDPAFAALVDATLNSINALTDETEMLGLNTEAQARRRIEIESGNMAMRLREEALRSNNDITESEAQLIDGLIRSFEQESLSLLESTEAQIANTDARGGGTAAIDEEVAALAALEAANQRLAEDFIDVIAGADSFKDALNGVLKMLVKLAATSFLQGLFGVAPSNQSGLGSVFSGLGSSIFSPRATGGPVSAGSPYMVGEQGPEPFIPAQNGRILSVAQAKSAVGGGGGGSSIVMNLSISTGVQSTVRAEMVQLLPQIESVAKRAVLDANQRGGSFRKSLMGG
jgi:hypothetical protein